jgi:hypothetical protein
MVAAFAYATILFISLTSSSYSQDIYLAFWLRAAFFSSLSFSNSSMGIFFFFSSYNLCIYSLFALANASLYYFYYSISFLYCYNSSFVGFLIVSYLTSIVPSFCGDRSSLRCQFMGDCSFCFSPSKLLFWAPLLNVMVS